MSAARVIVALSMILAVAMCIAADSPKNTPKPAAATPPPSARTAAPIQPMPAHLRVVAYHVTVPADRADDLDHEKILAAASSAKALRAELAEFGKLRVTCLIDQDIDLAHETSIQVGASRPTPSGSQTFNGQTSTQVQYQDCGCIVNLNARWENDDKQVGQGKMKIEASAIDQSPIKLGANVFAPVFLKNTSDFGLTFVSGKTGVYLTLENTEIRSGATVHVAEVTITRLDPEPQ